MKKIVVKAKNGSMEALRNNDLDLRKFGEVSVRRSSEIQFDEQSQLFYVEFLEPQLTHYNSLSKHVQFPTYEKAIEYEILILNQARLIGVL